jgi:hypothetical protein
MHTHWFDLREKYKDLTALLSAIEKGYKALPQGTTGREKMEGHQGRSSEIEGIEEDRGRSMGIEEDRRISREMDIHYARAHFVLQEPTNRR